MTIVGDRVAKEEKLIQWINQRHMYAMQMATLSPRLIFKMYTSSAKQLKGNWIKIKDTGKAPQAHGSVLLLASRFLSIPKLLEVNLWPAISL